MIARDALININIMAGKIIINGVDVADSLNGKIRSNATNITSAAGTYGVNNTTTGTKFTIPLITVTNERVKTVGNKTVTLAKSHCSYCTYCSYDNQCNTD